MSDRVCVKERVREREYIDPNVCLLTLVSCPHPGSTPTLALTLNTVRYSVIMSYDNTCYTIITGINTK